MKRLRLGAVLHFIIAIGHVACLFALDEAFEAYGIRDFRWLQFISSLVPAIIAWCYWPGVMRTFKQI